MLGHVLLDQPVLDLLDTLRAVATAGSAAGELSDQRRRYALDLPAGVAVLASVDRRPGHAEQPRGVVGEKGVVRLGESDRRP